MHGIEQEQEGRRILLGDDDLSLPHLELLRRERERLHGIHALDARGDLSMSNANTPDHLACSSSLLAAAQLQLGKSLDGSVEVYNKAVGSLDTNVMPAARRLREMGAAGNEGTKAVHIVEAHSRPIKTSPELDP